MIAMITSIIPEPTRRHLLIKLSNVTLAACQRLLLVFEWPFLRIGDISLLLLVARLD
jgi:hypothetical protein